MIIPAILEKNYDQVLLALEKYSKMTTKIQIDVCDGLYVNNKTWLPSMHDDINGYGLELEFDMMVSDVKSYLNTLCIYDAKYIVVHVSCISDLELRKIYADIKQKNKLIKVGIAIKNGNSLNRVYDNYNFFDYVQIMGIKDIGAQGQSFDKSIIDKIKLVKEFIDIKYREEHISMLASFPKEKKYIQIDGAMSPESIESCKRAGATSFCVGSYLKKSTDLKRDFNLLSRI
jgi:ribulose-phosphate 3-epimerase